MIKVEDRNKTCWVKLFLRRLIYRNREIEKFSDGLTGVLPKHQKSAETVEIYFSRPDDLRCVLISNFCKRQLELPCRRRGVQEERRPCVRV